MKIYQLTINIETGEAASEKKLLQEVEYCLRVGEGFGVDIKSAKLKPIKKKEEDLE